MAYQSAARELTLTNPTITGGTITGGTITGATVDGFVGTAGAGNLTAYKLCYYDSGTSTLLHAKADAIATSRKIMGVTTAAVTAAASATLKRRGYARITADGSCSPVIGAEAYLSGATAGCVASAISGTVYPRQVGYFLEGAVAGDGTVLVELALDDARDDAREWILSDTTYTGTATSFSVSTTRTLWDTLIAEVSGCGDTTDAAMTYPTDVNSTYIYNHGTGFVEWLSNGQACAATPAGAADSGVDIRLVDRYTNGTNWTHACESISRSLGGGTVMATGNKVSPADAIGLDGGAVSWLRIGTRVRVSGKVRLS